MTSGVFIGLGSNLGDRRANVLGAVAAIGEIPKTRVLKASSLYESEPHGDATTWFVNGVIEVETALLPRDLLKRLKAIEEAMGRKRVKGKRWGNRTIDLDILLFGPTVVKSRTLDIPHPQIPNRRFVLLPLAELAPQVIHPTLAVSVSALLAHAEDPKTIRLLPAA